MPSAEESSSLPLWFSPRQAVWSLMRDSALWSHSWESDHWRKPKRWRILQGRWKSTSSEMILLLNVVCTPRNLLACSVFRTWKRLRKSMCFLDSVLMKFHKLIFVPFLSPHSFYEFKVRSARSEKSLFLLTDESCHILLWFDPIRTNFLPGWPPRSPLCLHAHFRRFFLTWVAKSNLIISMRMWLCESSLWIYFDRLFQIPIFGRNLTFVFSTGNKLRHLQFCRHSSQARSCGLSLQNTRVRACLFPRLPFECASLTMPIARAHTRNSFISSPCICIYPLVFITIYSIPRVSSFRRMYTKRHCVRLLRCWRRSRCSFATIIRLPPIQNLFF